MGTTVSAQWDSRAAASCSSLHNIPGDENSGLSPVVSGHQAVSSSYVPISCSSTPTSCGAVRCECLEGTENSAVVSSSHVAMSEALTHSPDTFDPSFQSLKPTLAHGPALAKAQDIAFLAQMLRAPNNYYEELSGRTSTDFTNPGIQIPPREPLVDSQRVLDAGPVPFIGTVSAETEDRTTAALGAVTPTSATSGGKSLGRSLAARLERERDGHKKVCTPRKSEAKTDAVGMVMDLILNDYDALSSAISTEGKNSQASPAIGCNGPSSSPGDQSVTDTSDVGPKPLRQRIFTITISRKQASDRLGIDVSQQDGRTLLVLEVKTGLVASWNQMHPLMEVRPGDRILQVNAVQNRSDLLLKECQRLASLEMTIKRARVLTPDPGADPSFSSRAGQLMQRNKKVGARQNLSLERMSPRNLAGFYSSRSCNGMRPEGNTPAASEKVSLAREEALAPTGEYFRSDDAIRALLKDGDVVLIRGFWLVELAQRQGVLPRRQDLPKSALWAPDEVFRPSTSGAAGGPHTGASAETTPATATVAGESQDQPLRRGVEIVVVSYRWLTPDHPDPHGEQLRSLSRAVQQFYQTEKHDIAVFIDWCSLYQCPRTASEQLAFDRGLDQIGLWYVHQHTWKWMLTEEPKSCDVLPFKERAWPTFECLLGQMVTQFDMQLNLGSCDQRACQDWRATVLACSPTATQPPMLPDEFAGCMQAKVCSNSDDRAFLVAKYRKIFQDVFGTASRLDFSFRGWGDEEARQLANAMTHFECLKCLYLNWNHIGDEGAEDISARFPSCASLRELSLAGNPISAGRAQRLRQAWQNAGKSEQLLILW